MSTAPSNSAPPSPAPDPAPAPAVSRRPSALQIELPFPPPPSSSPSSAAAAAASPSHHPPRPPSQKSSLAGRKRAKSTASSSAASGPPRRYPAPLPVGSPSTAGGGAGGDARKNHDALFEFHLPHPHVHHQQQQQQTQQAAIGADERARAQDPAGQDQPAVAASLPTFQDATRTTAPAASRPSVVEPPPPLPTTFELALMRVTSKEGRASSLVSLSALVEYVLRN